MEAGTTPQVYVVPSWRGEGVYEVNPHLPSCTCPAFKHRHGECKHIKVVRAYPQRYQLKELE